MLPTPSVPARARQSDFSDDLPPLTSVFIIKIGFVSGFPRRRNKNNSPAAKIIAGIEGVKKYRARKARQDSIITTKHKLKDLQMQVL
jgi:hypothetical protein